MHQIALDKKKTMKVKTLSEIYWTDVHALCICLCISVFVFDNVSWRCSHTGALLNRCARPVTDKRPDIPVHKISYTALWKNHRAVQRTGSKDKGGTYTWHGHMVDDLLRDLLPAIQSCDQCNNLWFIFIMIYNAVHLYSAEVRTGMRDKGGTWQWPDFACFHGLNCLLNIIFIVIFFISIQVLTNKALSQKKTLNPIVCWRKHSAWTDIKWPRCRKTVDFFWDILLQQQ